MKVYSHIKLLFISLSVIYVQACDSQSSLKADSFNISNTKLALHSNDRLVDCGEYKKSDEDVCLSIEGINVEELIGKSVGYSLILLNNNWYEQDRDYESIYGASDPLTTPPKIEIKYRNYWDDECGDEVQFHTHIDQSETKMTLQFVTRKVNCAATP